MKKMKQVQSETLDTRPKKEKKGINAFVLLFWVLVVMAILSYILPAGQYARKLIDGRNVVVQGTYHVMDKTPVDFFHLFTSIHQGLVEAAPIVFYIIYNRRNDQCHELHRRAERLAGSYRRETGKTETCFLSQS